MLAAIWLTGSGEATVGELEQRMRCSRCSNRQVGVMVRPDIRPHEARERGAAIKILEAGLGD